MKKFVFAGVLILLLFCSCKDEETDYAELIVGKWGNTLVNYEPILTDASFICEYRSDMVQLYANGFKLDDINKTWMENDNYEYDVEDKNIIIDGTDVLDHSYHMEFEILLIDENYLTYSVKKFFIDDVDYPDSNIYTCKKVKNDYSEQFTGVWYGKCTTAGTSDTKFHYWEYFADGSFNYYYLDDAEKWIKKSDNEGGYFLYGTLLATNYTNDLVSGGNGKAYECWNIEINGNNMTWTGLRENNHVVTYQMVRVESAPTVSGQFIM